MARVDDRRVLSGIVHALRNGGRWADCPREVYGPKKTLADRIQQLMKGGDAALCWVHAERLIHKLVGFNHRQRQACARIRRVWWFYPRVTCGHRRIGCYSSRKFDPPESWKLIRLARRSANKVESSAPSNFAYPASGIHQRLRNSDIRCQVTRPQISAALAPARPAATACDAFLA